MDPQDPILFSSSGDSGLGELKVTAEGKTLWSKKQKSLDAWQYKMDPADTYK